MSNSDWIDNTPLPDTPASRDLSGETGESEADTPAGAWPEETIIRYFADSSLTIPGVGDKPDSCGVWAPKGFCGHEGHVQMGPSRCGLRDCPDCWTDWVRDSANRITRRLAAARQAEPHGMERRAVHAVAGPSPGSVKTLEQFYRMISDAYDLAKEKGIRGGVAIPHGWRVKEEFKTLFRIKKDRGDEDVDGIGIWSWIRENVKDWRSQVYWSPHVHIVGLSEDTGPNDPANDDGWIFKRIRTLSNFKIRDAESYDDMLGLAHYIMSHASFDPNASKQSVRWFGSLAPAAFSPEGELGVLETTDSGRDILEIDVIEEITDTVQNGGADDEEEECEVCGSTDLHPIWEAGSALQNQRWCSRIGRDNEKRLLAAYRWVIGEAVPPPGLQRPSTEEEAQESLESLV